MRKQSRQIFFLKAVFFILLAVQLVGCGGGGGGSADTTADSSTGNVTNTASDEPALAPPVNSAPVISGSPAGTVEAGTTYSFRPTASDAEGDRLTFSISGRPSWASFSTSTGRLSGTPGAGDVRTYRNIVIAVSDGTDTTALPAFSITVDPAPVVVGAFTLTWTAPATRSDGTPMSLAEIDGYRIHYGDTSGQYSNTFEVNDGSSQSALVENIPTGTYHVVMTTIDSNGLESAYSTEVVKAAR